MDVPRDLTPQEVRVLGCLVEKEATTPDNYPLTLNSLRNACNQSTSRDPVVDYGELEIEQALKSLRERGLTRTVHSTSNRATKFRHVLPDALGLDAAETAVLSVLMLRGAQTLGEIKGRTERQHTFESIEACQEVLQALAARSEPLVVQLARQPGQKDARWIHLLTPIAEPSASAAGDRPGDRSAPGRPAELPVDPYGEATAEFYDLLAGHQWEDVALQLLDLLDAVDVAVGPVVDVGAGTGIGLSAIRDAAPGAQIWAIEPSSAMRAALHARLNDEPALRAAVTVVPSAFGEARLPPTACALLACASFGHLAAGERQRLWRYVAEQMPGGAPAVIGLLPPARPVEVEPTRYASVRVGQFTYEGWQHGEPDGERTMRWTMGYRVLDAGGALVAERSASARWTCDAADDVRAEAAEFGLSVTVHDGWVVARSVPSPVSG